MFLVVFYCFFQNCHTYFTVENFINITGPTENPNVVKLLWNKFSWKPSGSNAATFSDFFKGRGGGRHPTSSWRAFVCSTTHQLLEIRLLNQWHNFLTLFLAGKFVQQSQNNCSNCTVSTEFYAIYFFSLQVASDCGWNGSASWCICLSFTVSKTYCRWFYLMEVSIKII